MKVLLVEDDADISNWLTKRLVEEQHECVQVQHGQQALVELAHGEFDIIVLDRMLPDVDGLDVLKQLAKDKHPPVIILSTIDGASERVVGLRAGADDYLGKPFDFSELLVRMELVVRRAREREPANLSVHIQDLSIDLLRRKVSRAGRNIELTDKEYLLLCTLAENPGQTVPRGMLLEKVWGLQFDPNTNLIDVHVSKLRSKVDRDFPIALLRTVRSLGYVLG